MSSNSPEHYYIPEPSRWPLIGSMALCLAFVGGATALNGFDFGIFLLGLGVAAIVYLFCGWFSDVIRESLGGNYNKQVDISFRWGMGWFILSEVMFFAAFFGALLYIRLFSVPWLSGEGAKYITHITLWPDFSAAWPLLIAPDAESYMQIKSVIPAWGLPAINTFILLTSGATVTFAHWALKKNQNTALCGWLAATVALGFFFVYLQGIEYFHAYNELGLTLNSGVYGSTFFMLTGFHGFHVTMGAIMLAVILVRAMKKHFTAENHFAFEAVAWYWHFVDVVWLGLFIFVYWI
ncbi:MAG: cytochrome c oxidase subunit 3 [Candidatus Eutrophobiaceae bacterium]